MDDDIIRILISTDNHLGFMEKDPVRCNDAMASFEEALHTAKAKNADMMLLAGDMFHENKPSRRTLHGAIDLMKKYCFGDSPVYIEMLNEQSEVFKNRSGMINYEDPFQAIGLPVFAIHGNHDDPSREGGSESLSAMDLLSVSNCVNYFGKAEQVDNIDITPILLRKGSTLLAIYGLGAIRDERLNRMWNQNKIRFVRPVQDKEEFFNIFVLHQNRDYGRGAKNCVHESMIPEWIDLVICASAATAGCLSSYLSLCSVLCVCI
jgi:double-strand break repair protein MRE11